MLMSMIFLLFPSKKALSHAELQCFPPEIRLFFLHLIGIEPTHAAPEATALSTELQVQQ